MPQVFVYGTLRRGERNYGLLAAAHFVREVQTAPQYTLYSLGSHPGMGPDGVTSVRGEIFDVDAATLAALDALESHPDWYVRTAIALADGSSVEGYLLPPRFTEHLEQIPHGDWVRWRQSQLPRAEDRA